ncbi:MAG TPA: hypothetical protein VFN50_03010 [Acidimicrobiales bacterium]|nr:hypothetical protein [Acidimicrobiales bacterium]
MSRRQAARRWSRAAILPVVLGGGLLLSACGSGASGLAKQACGYIHKASELQASGNATPSRVTRELQLAGPIAADAAGSSSAWQALSANLDEVGTVPNHVVLPALRADCNAVGV